MTNVVEILASQQPSNQDPVDIAKKQEALQKVFNVLHEDFQVNPVTWEKLDFQMQDAIASSVVGLVHLGKYKAAALGLVYLIYQNEIEETNKADSRLKSGIPTQITTQQD